MSAAAISKSPASMSPGKMNSGLAVPAATLCVLAMIAGVIVLARQAGVESGASASPPRL